MGSDPAAFAVLLGFLAGTLTTLAFVPQVAKTWRTRSAAGLSVWMVATFNAGIVLWIAYGIVTRTWPVIAANVVTLVLGLMLLWMTIRYR
ncbi:MAG: SemiSWEET transporter [Vicinamibacterales bacterium]